MNTAAIFDLVIGFGVSFFNSQGNPRVVSTLKKLQEARISGANVDAHMASVAQSLINEEPMDWNALDAEIDAEVDAFLRTSDNDAPVSDGDQISQN